SEASTLECLALTGERSGCDAKGLGLLAINAAFALLYRRLTGRESVIWRAIGRRPTRAYYYSTNGLRSRETSWFQLRWNMLKQRRDERQNRQFCWGLEPSAGR